MLTFWVYLLAHFELFKQPCASQLAFLGQLEKVIFVFVFATLNFEESLFFRILSHYFVDLQKVLFEF